MHRFVAADPSVLCLNPRQSAGTDVANISSEDSDPLLLFDTVSSLLGSF